MRCTPMAVFTSQLKPKDARVLIEAEISITHPHQAVKDCEFLYQLAIHHLLNNPKKKDRAEEAFAYAYNINLEEFNSKLGIYVSDRDHQDHSCQKWLDIAL